jgi:hypothetical protein
MIVKLGVGLKLPPLLLHLASLHVGFDLLGCEVV